MSDRSAGRVSACPASSVDAVAAARRRGPCGDRETPWSGRSDRFSPPPPNDERRTATRRSGPATRRPGRRRHSPASPSGATGRRRSRGRPAPMTARVVPMPAQGVGHRPEGHVLDVPQGIPRPPRSARAVQAGAPAGLVVGRRHVRRIALAPKDRSRRRASCPGRRAARRRSPRSG